MMHWFEPTGTEQALATALQDMAANGASAIQILAAVGNSWTEESMRSVLSASPVPVFGGLFAGLIVEGAQHDKGFILIGHVGRCEIRVFDVRDKTLTVDDGLTWSEAFVCYYDATASMGVLLEELYDALGPRPSWIGGCAGSLEFVDRPVVITPHGLLAGVAVVVALSGAIRVGVAHGWQPIGPPLRVTAAEGTELISLDWRPAFEVYREIVESHSGLSFGDCSFYELASRYPLFLERIAGEGIVRDPLSLGSGGVLRCVADVPNHATLRVATADKTHVLEAARTLRELVTEQGVPAGTVALTIDCVSRALFLGDRIREELDGLAIAGCPQLGALTIGELASCQRRPLQLHNKTVVLGLVGS